MILLTQPNLFNIFAIAPTGVKVWFFVFLISILCNTQNLAIAQDESHYAINIGHAKLMVVEWTPDSESPELILALPGSGGDFSRYKRIGPLLAEAGYRIVVINQRGIMGSTGQLESLTLHDLADDVISVADHFGARRFHMVGWAFGNRTSRMLATDYPERVASVTLIAAGGIVPALTKPGELGSLLGDKSLTFNEKKGLARRTLFSPSTDEKIVEDYVKTLSYWPAARAAQQNANRNTPLEEWVDGGKGPLLMVMGEDDLTAPIENGHLMKAEHGERLRLVIVPNAGHAIGLEKPTETAATIVEFLKGHPL
ncbi:MAG: hypothetical protein CMD92_10120 [Gammaproteobacteria bacterium]|nr:hypothetical protein [Gammaproteobacteria bacterium]